MQPGTTDDFWLLSCHQHDFAALAAAAPVFFHSPSSRCLERLPRLPQPGYATAHTYTSICIWSTVLHIVKRPVERGLRAVIHFPNTFLVDQLVTSGLCNGANLALSAADSVMHRRIHSTIYLISDISLSFAPVFQFRHLIILRCMNHIMISLSSFHTSSSFFSLFLTSVVLPHDLSPNPSFLLLWLVINVNSAKFLVTRTLKK